MIKCIQNFVDKSESLQLMEHLKNDKDKVFGKKKHFDYVPVLYFLFRSLKWFIRLSKPYRKPKSIRSIL